MLAVVHLGRDERKPVFGVSIQVNACQNQPAQLQRLARIVKFRLEQFSDKQITKVLIRLHWSLLSHLVSWDRCVT